MKHFAVVLLLAAGAAHAADKATAEAALATATQAENEAGTLGNRWVPAEAALKAAKVALAKGAWDEAAAQAEQAHALATRAIEQSHEQETAWRDAVIQ